MKMMGRGGMMMGMGGMAGIAQETASFNIGDKVRIKAGQSHDMDDMTMVGTVVEIGSPALAIKFPDDAEPHKWYVAEELEPADSDQPDGHEGMGRQRVAQAMMRQRT